jgi:hypothetical protein
MSLGAQKQEKDFRNGFYALRKSTDVCGYCQQICQKRNNSSCTGIG